MEEITTTSQVWPEAGTNPDARQLLKKISDNLFTAQTIVNDIVSHKHSAYEEQRLVTTLEQLTAISTFQAGKMKHILKGE